MKLKIKGPSNNIVDVILLEVLDEKRIKVYVPGSKEEWEISYKDIVGVSLTSFGREHELKVEVMGSSFTSLVDEGY